MIPRLDSRIQRSGSTCRPAHSPRSGSSRGPSVTRCTAQLQPATMPAAPGAVTPMPKSPVWVSGPALKTGISDLRPSAFATSARKFPVGPKPSIGGGTEIPPRPTASAIPVAGCPSVRSSRPASTPAAWFTDSSPVRRNASQSESVTTVEILSKRAGRSSWNHLMRAHAARNDGRWPVVRHTRSAWPSSIAAPWNTARISLFGPAYSVLPSRSRRAIPCRWDVTATAPIFSTPVGEFEIAARATSMI